MARRMRSDWGSVTEMERGKRYRLRWWASTPEGYKRCSRVVRGTRREAMDELARIRLAHSADALRSRGLNVKWLLDRAEAVN